jgi:hypothetical protein
LPQAVPLGREISLFFFPIAPGCTFRKRNLSFVSPPLPQAVPLGREISLFFSPPLPQAVPLGREVSLFLPPCPRLYL